MILVNVLLGFSQFFRAIPIMNPLPWFMIIMLPLCSMIFLVSYKSYLFMNYECFPSSLYRLSLLYKELLFKYFSGA